ncbi:uncharacterized protein [Coffea arabica]|uniref:Uncharacterized protein isoform X2 n=1 Tax=Coffea arabica TaxID=13443 RepID=A0A6P6UQU7_COFAR|nr:uncharacterized protein LOC113712729 isoform X2 [Coffea arabica]
MYLASMHQYLTTEPNSSSLFFPPNSVSLSLTQTQASLAELQNSFFVLSLIRFIIPRVHPSLSGIEKMEDYLQYMRTLRTQMTEVEDQATKLSAQQQIHLTTIRNVERDLDFVKNETKRVIEEKDRIMKEKGLICSQILEKQRKITSLELDSSTLNQTLDLMQHERVTQSTKLLEKSSYYTKVAGDIITELKDQQGWIIANECSFLDTENGLVGNNITREICETEESQGNIMKSLLMKFDAAKAELDQVVQMKYNLVLENSKIKHAMELVKGKLNEYKEISHPVKCSCGEEYRVELGAYGEA